MTATTSERPPQNDEVRPPTPEDSDASDEEGWQDVEQSEDESQPIVGLFSDKIYPDVNAMLQETKDKHDFDLQGIRKEFGVYIYTPYSRLQWNWPLGSLVKPCSSVLAYLCLRPGEELAFEQPFGMPGLVYT